MKERVIGRKFKKNSVYCDPDGKFKIMRLPLYRDGRSNNGNSDNFKNEAIAKIIKPEISGRIVYY